MDAIEKKIRDFYIEKDSQQCLSFRYEEFKTFCMEIWKMGVQDGEAFVWNRRAGKFVDNEGNPVDINGAPRDESEDPLEGSIMISTNGHGEEGTETYLYDKEALKYVKQPV